MGNYTKVSSYSPQKNKGRKLRKKYDIFLFLCSYFIYHYLSPLNFFIPFPRALLSIAPCYVRVLLCLSLLLNGLLYLHCLLLKDTRGISLFSNTFATVSLFFIYIFFVFFVHTHTNNGNQLICFIFPLT